MCLSKAYTQSLKELRLLDTSGQEVMLDALLDSNQYYIIKHFCPYNPIEVNELQIISEFVNAASLDIKLVAIYTDTLLVPSILPVPERIAQLGVRTNILLEDRTNVHHCGTDRPLFYAYVYGEVEAIWEPFAYQTISESLEQYSAAPKYIWQPDMTQTLKKEHCQDWGYVTHFYDFELSLGERYVKIPGAIFRLLNNGLQLQRRYGSLYITVLDYNLETCGHFLTRDGDRDTMHVVIQETYYQDDLKYLVTNREIVNSCGDTLPWIWIEGMGTNGGLDFNIEDGYIRTQLICHSNADTSYFLDDIYGSYCGINTNIYEEIDGTGLKIYPNPNDGTMYLSEPLSGEYILRDLNGGMIEKADLHNGMITITAKDLQGLYVLSIQEKNMMKVSFHKIVILKE